MYSKILEPHEVVQPLYLVTGVSLNLFCSVIVSKYTRFIGKLVEFIPTFCHQNSTFPYLFLEMVPTFFTESHLEAYEQVCF